MPGQDPYTELTQFCARHAPRKLSEASIRNIVLIDHARERASSASDRWLIADPERAAGESMSDKLNGRWGRTVSGALTAYAANRAGGALELVVVRFAPPGGFVCFQLVTLSAPHIVVGCLARNMQ